MPITGNNLVKETCIGTGAGALTLTGASATFFSFLDAGLISGRACYYSLKSGAEREVGRGVYTSPVSLSRDAVFQSSNGNTHIPLGAGTHEVIVTIPYSKLVFLDETDQLAEPTPFRQTVIKDYLQATGGYLAEAAPDDNEGVLALGVASEFDLLGGLFAVDTAAGGTADNRDLFSHATAAGLVRRAGIKVAPTTRGQTIPAGNELAIRDVATADQSFYLSAHADNSPSHSIEAYIFGGATPEAISTETGDLEVIFNSTEARIRNNGTVSHDVSTTLEVIS